METIKIKITHGVTQKSEIITMEQAIDILEGLYTKNKVVKDLLAGEKLHTQDCEYCRL